MEIRSLDRDRLGPGNNHSQRLMPWEALNAPFEGAWCVIKPGTASVKHAHHEYEIFIAVTGEATLESGGERTRFRPGDLVHFPPHIDHQVINEGQEDFEMYAVWWDLEMSEKFTGRHQKEV
ncbi:MAG: Gentisate 1,2-dioxygenase [Sphaerisporangium sp.]|nr:Gentisate 1,2-dioxygenase [Sphaerisporangium sp.]